MAMLKDEMQVLKGVMVEIDQDHVVLATHQYHTEADPATGKQDRSKSQYRWLARAMSKDDVKKLIDDYMSDEKRLERGHWPNDKLDFYLAIGNGSENWRIGGFFRTKLAKLRDWDYGMKVLNGWENKSKLHDEGYNPTAKYVIDGYTAENGDIVSLADKEALLKHLNQNLYASNPFKRKTLAKKTA